MMTALLSYILLGLALSMAPGAMTVQMVKQALRNGFLSGWFVGLGGMTIDLTLITLIYFGLSPLLTHPMVEIFMWLLGFIFLLVIGADSLKESRTPVDFSGSAPRKSLAKAYTSGFLMAISPANIVFWIGIFGPLLASSLTGESQVHFIIVAAGILIGILIHDLGLMSIIHYTRKLLNQAILKWVSIIAALILFGFSVYFGYEFINQLWAYI
ncbi:LysE family transporter [Virgibacillus sp. NKC19-16]|uniref:LysE family translocator n=1 Tax=Virgibacillus salidurans TaxID=2831673 RepID=UPI001F42AA7D|nr:LysE family transporter [Virgibacillus sp. NKC19-16]UJL48138.1 LysE family transporter [Virgibacillus sp. NKC19-16]